MTAKAKTPATTPPEFPKPLVRLTPAPGGYAAEVRMVADSDAEAAATAEGFQVVAIPERGSDFAEYPKWLYHADGRAVVVPNQAEADTLAGEGFEDTPPAPPEPVATAGSTTGARKG